VKKGVVLLITLLMISAISILTLKNLDDSETFMDEVSLQTELTQIRFTQKNVQDEIISFINKRKEMFDAFTQEEELGVFPFSYGDVQLMVSVTVLGKNEDDNINCDINNIKNEEDLLTLCGDDIAFSIENRYTFIQVLLQYINETPISTDAELSYVIDQYKKLVDDRSIDTIKNEFQYGLSADENATYIQCITDIVINEYTEAQSRFLFKVGEETPLRSFFFLK